MTDALSRYHLAQDGQGMAHVYDAAQFEYRASVVRTDLVPWATGTGWIVVHKTLDEPATTQHNGGKLRLEGINDADRWAIPGEHGPVLYFRTRADAAQFALLNY